MTEPTGGRPASFVQPAAEGAMLHHIADRVLGRPLLLHPSKVEVILHVLEGRIPIGGALPPLGPDASRFVGTNRAADGKTQMTYRVDNGVALISVIGSLVNRGAWIGAYSGMTSYEGIAKQLDDVSADFDAGKVRGLVLDMDSPGGEATGMFTVAAKVRALAAKMPVIACVNDMAASAAYGIASQASEIVVSPTSIVGSIGVVLTHVDRSKELANKGLTATMIFAGAHKVDGHPFGPLPDAVKADLQAEVFQFYDQFVNLVGQGRGERMTDQQARATEARTYIGQDAVDRGLADRVATLEEVTSSLRGGQPRPRINPPKKEPLSMTTTTEAPNAGITQEAHAAAVATARAEGVAEGRRAGAPEATARIGAILNSEEAKGRETLASHFAFNTDMSADAAKAALGVAPKADAAAAAQPQPFLTDLAARYAQAGGVGGSPAVPGAAAADNEIVKGLTDATRTLIQRTH